MMVGSEINRSEGAPAWSMTSEVPAQRGADSGPTCTGSRFTAHDGGHAVTRTGSRPAAAPEPQQPPVYRSVLAVDIENSTTRRNPGRGVARRLLYELFDQALRTAGITGHHDPLVDRGDGILALIRPDDQVPKTVLLETFVPTIADLLREHWNGTDWALRLRVAVHAGEVHYDQWGPFGEAIDLTCRLLDAPDVKRRLRKAAWAPLALVVSDDIYTSVVQQGYDGIDADGYGQVHVNLGGRRHTGWVRCVGMPAIRSVPPAIGLGA
jgi:class 3 adenylate cyclase